MEPETPAAEPHSEVKRKKRFPLRTFLLLLIAVVFSLGILEIGGRVLMRQRYHRMLVSFPATGWKDVHQYDPDLMWTLKPNVHNVTQIMTQENPVTSYINTNNLGLRNPPIGEKGSRTRILAVGCSTTFGAGVNDNETWPAQLQALLDKAAPNRFEVINAGVSGYSAYQGLVYLEKHGFDLQPNIVIACFGQNDHSEVPPNGLHDLEWFNPEETSGITLLVRQAMKGAGLAWTGPDIVEKRGRIAYGQFTDIMLRIASTCNQHRATCAFLIWPYEYELKAPPYMPPAALIQAMGLYAGARVIDLTDMIRNTKEKLYYDGLHMNAHGNALVAEKVATDMKFISPTPKPAN